MQQELPRPLSNRALIRRVPDGSCLIILHNCERRGRANRRAFGFLAEVFLGGTKRIRKRAGVIGRADSSSSVSSLQFAMDHLNVRNVDSSEDIASPCTEELLLQADY